MAVKKEKCEPVNNVNVTEATKGILENEEQKFPLNILKHDCLRLYGVTLSTFVGATFDIPEGEYSIKEIESKIKTWLEKEAE